MHCVHCLRRTYCNCIRFMLANAFVERKQAELSLEKIRPFPWDAKCIPWCNIIYNCMHAYKMHFFFSPFHSSRIVFLSLGFRIFLHKRIYCLGIATVENEWYMYNAFIGNVRLKRMLTSVDLYIKRLLQQ